jgi:hypothetical protein
MIRVIVKDNTGFPRIIDALDSEQAKNWLWGMACELAKEYGRAHSMPISIEIHNLPVETKAWQQLHSEI